MSWRNQTETPIRKVLPLLPIGRWCAGAAAVMPRHSSVVVLLPALLPWCRRFDVVDDMSRPCIEPGYPSSCKRWGTCREPFNSTPIAVNSIPSSPPHVRPMGRTFGSIPSGSPHVRPMGVHRTCGEPGEIKKNTRSKQISPFFVARRFEHLHALVPSLHDSRRRPRQPRPGRGQRDTRGRGPRGWRGSRRRPGPGPQGQQGGASCNNGNAKRSVVHFLDSVNPSAVIEGPHGAQRQIGSEIELPAA